MSLLRILTNYEHLVKACLHVLSLSPSNLHCMNGDGPFDGQIRYRTHSARQRSVSIHKLTMTMINFDGDGDGDGDGTCKQDFK